MSSARPKPRTGPRRNGAAGGGRTKQTTRQLPAIDVRTLAREGWILPGQERASVFARFRKKDGAEVVVLLDVPLAWTSCNFGGSRPWFVCPGEGCGWRAALLYGPESPPLCRRCLDLAYEKPAPLKALWGPRGSEFHEVKFRKKDPRPRVGNKAALLWAFLSAFGRYRDLSPFPVPRNQQEVVEIQGIPFCEGCAREQEAYFAIGKLTQEAQGLQQGRIRAHPRVVGELRSGDRRRLALKGGVQ